jgi:protease-4
MEAKKIRRLLLAGLVLLVAGCITVKVSVFPEAGPLKEQVVSGHGRDKVLLLDVSGMILQGPRGWLHLTSATTAARVKEELDKAGKDDRVKALVLRINSPGGTVSASDIIYHELMAFKEKKKAPVVACFLGLAASGSYYAAQAADTIIATPTGITGSIGVIAMKFNVKGLMDKIGVDPEMVKTGQWKDFWSPFKASTPKEKEMMQNIIDQFYQDFVEVVAKGRKQPVQVVRQWADGRVFTAKQALDLGLVDRVGYLDDAIALAKDKAGIDEESRVVRYRREGTYKPTIYSMLPQLDPTSGLGPQFLYFWWPGELSPGF